MVLSIRKILQNSRGSTAILVLGGMLIFSILGAGLMTISKTSQNTATDYRDGVATEYIAEAGVHDLLAQIKAGAHDSEINNALNAGKDNNQVVKISSLQNFSPQPNQTGSYDVTLKYLLGEFHVVATGTLSSNGGKKTTTKKIDLTITLTPNTSDDPNTKNPFGKYIVYSKKSMDLNSGIKFNDLNDMGNESITIQDIGSDGDYNGHIHTTDRLVNGTAWAYSTANYPPPSPYWNTNNIAAHWKPTTPDIVETVATLTVSPAQFSFTPANPPKPSTDINDWKEISSNRTELRNQTLDIPDPRVRWKGNLTLYSAAINFTADKVEFYVDGDLEFNIQSTPSAMYGKDITIYAKHIRILNGGFVGTKDPTQITPNHKLTLYASSGDVNNHSIEIGGGSVLQSGNIKTWSPGTVWLNNPSKLLTPAYFTSDTPETDPQAQKLPQYQPGTITLESFSGDIHLDNNLTILSGLIKFNAGHKIDITSGMQMNMLNTGSTNNPFSNSSKPYLGNFKNSSIAYLTFNATDKTIWSNYSIGGKAVLVSSQGAMDVNSPAKQLNTVFLANNSDPNYSSTLSGAIMGPYYTNGALTITSGTRISYFASVMKFLGLATPATSGFKPTVIKTELEP